jgi:hypothetical protein
MLFILSTAMLIMFCYTDSTRENSGQETGEGQSETTGDPKPKLRAAVAGES